MRAAVVDMLSHIGRVDEARERLTDLAATGFDFATDATWLNSMMRLLDAAVVTQSPAIAEDLMDRIAPYANQVVSPETNIVHCSIARPLGRAATLLGDFGKAEEYFGIAHETNGALKAPFWTAHCQLDHADLCMARREDGDPQRARDFVAAASATAAAYGYAGLARRADALAEAI
jgi:hypothetical protein